MTAHSSTRYLSVWLTRLATDRSARAASPRSSAPADAQRGSAERDSAEHPLVVVAPVKSALRVTAMNAAAARLGLVVGMALADARAMHPHLAVADADPTADGQSLEAIADWCDRYTPLVGLQPPDGLILDISGCAHLFGGEAALWRDLVGRLGAHGFSVRAAIADTVGCAWAMARYAEASPLAPPPPARGRSPSEARRVGVTSNFDPHPVASACAVAPTTATDLPLSGGGGVRGSSCAHHQFIVPPGGARAALAPLPVAALRLPPEVVTLLAQVGLKHVADLLARPRAALAARFGTELLWRLDQAVGVDQEAITPRKPLPRYVAEQRFADPIALERDVLGTIQRLGDRLDRKLEQLGEGARLIEAVLFRADGKVLRLSAATSRPIRGAALVRRLFAERLAAIGDAHDPGFGFDMIRLSVIVADRLDPVQTGFNESDHAEEVAKLVDRIGARMGFRCVLRMVPHDTHVPEFSALEVRADRRAEDVSVAAPTMLRPLTLFARPEPVEAMAEVPDGPPVRFRWRHVLHEVTAAEGPERIAMEWWHDAAGAALTRDYFRIESREGARFWLFREGLYERETPQPRWFLHGLFA